MPRPHLPLSALRAFEAAFRQRGYSRAADELGLSHGAVSHHIKSLEQSLGVKLFRRDGHVMMPTEAGQRLALHVSEGMSRLAQGIEEVRARKLRSRIVTVSVLPAFAARWLIPRLASLHQSNPDIEVNIRASALLADFSHEGVDVGLRYGPGRWDGLTAELLYTEDIFPVCSPQFMEKNTLKEPRDLLKVTLLRDQRIPWSVWFRHVGMNDDVPIAAGSTYGDAGLLLHAAAAGHGVALARSALADNDLSAGFLVRPFDEKVAADFAYYLVYPRDRSLREPAAAFRQWLFMQLGQGHLR